MKLFSLHLVFGVLASAQICFAAHSAIDPVPRNDQFWRDRQNAFNRRVAEVGKKAQVIFIGDSITQGWEGEGRDLWAENFAKYDAINLGIGGDRTQHVLWRLDNGNLEGLSPKAAVVMIGTNNSNGEDNTAEQIADGVRSIVQKLRARLPDTKVLLIAIFPRGENPNPQRGKIMQVNQIIRRLADDQNVVWVDFGHKYIDDQGLIPRAIMPDYLHLSRRGYEIWAESLREPLNRALEGGRADSGANLGGNWIATMPGPNDEPVDLAFTLTQSGNSLSGAFHADGRDLKIENGRLSGNEFSWTVKRDRPNGGTLTYRMSGRVDSNRLRGSTVTDLEGQQITSEWSARRR